MPAAPFINRHGRHLLLRYKRVFRSTRWRSIQTLQLPQASVVAPQLGREARGNYGAASMASRALRRHHLTLDGGIDFNCRSPSAWRSHAALGVPTI